MNNLLSVEPHRRVRALLPWYATQRLDAAEQRDVAQHLDVCAACREELRNVQQLAEEVAHNPVAPEVDVNGFARLRARIVASGGQTAPTRKAPRTTPRWLWAMLAMQLLLIVALLPGALPLPVFRTLGVTPASTERHLLRVVFDPTLSEAALRDLLTGLPAQIADGPTRYGVYTLKVAASDSPRILRQLRARPEVRFAEPAAEQR
jgi:hypothetical protein